MNGFTDCLIGKLLPESARRVSCLLAPVPGCAHLHIPTQSCPTWGGTNNAGEDAAGAVAPTMFFWFIAACSGLGDRCLCAFLPGLLARRSSSLHFLEELLTSDGKGQSRTQKPEITRGHFVLTGCSQFLSSIFIQRPRNGASTIAMFNPLQKPLISTAVGLLSDGGFSISSSKANARS